jgi:uncharacterized membrane protein YphA (DoxX/SURF4 family)
METTERMAVATHGVLAGRARLWLGHAARCLLGLVFLAAGVLKGLDPAEFAHQVAGYGVVGGRLAAVAAPLLIALEITLGAALLAGLLPRAMAYLGAALLLGFIGLEAYGLSVGRTESCGCFGAHVLRTPRQVITEDVLFLALALLALWGLRAWKGRSGPGALTWLGVAAVLSLGFAVASPALPIDPLVTRLAVGRSLADLGLAGKVPGLEQGRHLVALLDLADPRTAASTGRLNEMVSRTGAPDVVALTSSTEEEMAAFQWSAVPAFPMHRLDRAALKPLYRRLPRFFLLDAGKVVAIRDAPPEASDLL